MSLPKGFKKVQEAREQEEVDRKTYFVNRLLAAIAKAEKGSTETTYRGEVKKISIHVVDWKNILACVAAVG
jgi:hypothetical protein